MTSEARAWVKPDNSLLVMGCIQPSSKNTHVLKVQCQLGLAHLNIIQEHKSKHLAEIA